MKKKYILKKVSENDFLLGIFSQRKKTKLLLQCVVGRKQVLMYLIDVYFEG